LNSAERRRCLEAGNENRWRQIFQEVFGLEAAPPRDLQEPADPVCFDLDQTAFFFDFDGTLADIVENPWEARLESQVREDLSKLSDAVAGALAIVSGRPVAALEEFLAPLQLPLAGVHGLERRSADGRITQGQIDSEAIAHATRLVEDFASANTGLVAERKRGSVALHYRNRPVLGSECLALAEEIAGADSRLKVLFGKMVVEIKTGNVTKADAIADFMSTTPFVGRRPVFAGDDTTDEDGFRAVARWDGVSIKIGEGPTAATSRLGSITEFRSWLNRMAIHATMSVALQPLAAFAARNEN
jgi:trehalose 6-phosphate phosphatase